MKITYINHSGFLLETKDCYYIFDYYKGELPHLDKEKEVIVFCSHFHKDHFNPQIFEILDDMGMTYQAVLANDIRKRNHLTDMKITYVYHDQTYNLDNDTKVDTLLSNDSGVAFIVKTKEGRSIFCSRLHGRAIIRSLRSTAAWWMRKPAET